MWSAEFRKCIECFLCQNVCHVVRDHEENKKAFAGPRFLMRVAELDMHPLDTWTARDMAQEDFGLGYCNITKCCTEVCLEHIKITDNALIPMKERVADRKYDPVCGSATSCSSARTEVGSWIPQDLHCVDVGPHREPAVHGNHPQRQRDSHRDP
jgi:Fe-S oxidoreductase